MSGAEALWGPETMGGMGQYGMPIGGSRLASVSQKTLVSG